jgi:tRNA threonylcarbamoyladenosine biosynthesis protein TsaE
VILLYGELGSGKTALVRGLAEGLGVTDPSLVRSPSYTLVNEYPCKNSTLYHLDFYRLDSLRDFYSIGLEEILANHAVVIIEWAEKLLLEVENPFTIRIVVESETGVRQFEIG